MLSTVLYYELAMKVPIPVGITVYLLTWGLGHLRCLVLLILLFILGDDPQKLLGGQRNFLIKYSVAGRDWVNLPVQIIILYSYFNFLHCIHRENT